MVTIVSPVLRERSQDQIQESLIILEARDQEIVAQIASAIDSLNLEPQSVNENRFVAKKAESDDVYVYGMTKNDQGAQLEIYKRTKPEEQITQAWVLSVGTPSEEVNVRTFTPDPKVLESLPAGMAAAYFPDIAVPDPTPEIRVALRNGKWECKETKDVEIQDLPTFLSEALDGVTQPDTQLAVYPKPTAN